MNKDNQNDVVTGASQTIDVNSGSSLMEPDKNKSEETVQIKSEWPGPKGMIPVTSGKADDANVHNRVFLDNILVEMRVIDAVEPDLTTTILGRKYSSPLMPAAVSHLNKVLSDKTRKPMQEKAIAARNMDLLNWIGMETNEEYGEVLEIHGNSIVVGKKDGSIDFLKASDINNGKLAVMPF